MDFRERKYYALVKYFISCTLCTHEKRKMQICLTEERQKISAEVGKKENMKGTKGKYVPNWSWFVILRR